MGNSDSIKNDKKLNAKRDDVNSSKSKNAYTSADKNYTINEDRATDYFRIESKTLIDMGRTRRKYTNINGNDINQVVVDGREIGRTTDEYKRATHILNEGLKDE